MRTNLTHRIRDVLRKAPDGLTTREIADALSTTANQVQKRLEQMPDAYKDRWTKNPGNNAWVAVYAVVVPPPDCPRPKKKKDLT